MLKFTNKNKKLLQYTFLFFLIGLTTYIVSTTLDIKLIPHIIKIVKFKYLICGICLMILYIVFEAIILDIIVKSLAKTKVKFIGFKIAIMGLYYNLVTPLASGSQPIQIYSLTKYNISISTASAIITNKTVVFQTIVTLYCGYFMYFNIDFLKNKLHSVLIIMIIGICMNLLMISLGVFIIISPKNIQRLSNKIIDFLSKFNVFKKLKYKKNNINEHVDEYSIAIRSFMKNKKAVFLSILLTIIQLTIFFSVSYCIYRSFGLDKFKYLELLTLQVFLYMAVSPAPTPGNVGANEIGFLTIFSTVFPKEIIGYAVFLYGGIMYYFMIVVCGIFTIYSHHNIQKHIRLKNMLKTNKKDSKLKFYNKI